MVEPQFGAECAAQSLTSPAEVLVVGSQVNRESKAGPPPF